MSVFLSIFPPQVCLSVFLFSPVCLFLHGPTCDNCFASVLSRWGGGGVDEHDFIRSRPDPEEVTAAAAAAAATKKSFPFLLLLLPEKAAAAERKNFFNFVRSNNWPCQSFRPSRCCCRRCFPGCRRPLHQQELVPVPVSFFGQKR